MLFNLFLQLTSKGKHVTRIKKKKNPILIYIFKLFYYIKNVTENIYEMHH